CLNERPENAGTVAAPAGDDVVELVWRDLLVRCAPADPQPQFAAITAIAVEMNAVSPHSEERNGAAVEAEDRRLAPAGHHVKRLIAPFRDAVAHHKLLDDIVNRSTDRIGIALRHQLHAVWANRKDPPERRERRRIVAPQPADPLLTGEKRDGARRIVVVARADMIGERHASRLRRAGGFRWSERFRPR